MIEAKLVLGRFETIFDGPALAFDLQRSHIGTERTPG